MRQIQQGLGDFLELQASHLIHHQSQYDGYREPNDQLQQADNHRVAQNRQNDALENSFTNCSKPTHWLADGLYWLYSMNAILKPNMGTYLKIAKNKIPGISRKYSQRYFTISFHVVWHLILKSTFFVPLFAAIFTLSSPLFVDKLTLCIFLRYLCTILLSVTFSKELSFHGLNSVISCLY